MNRHLPLWLAAGVLSSLLLLSLAKGIALGFLLSYLSPLPLMMIGLGYGMAASVIAGACGIVSVAVLADGLSTLPYLALAVLPTLVVTHRALLCRTAQNGTTEWYPPGLVLAWLTAAGLALLLLGGVLVADSPGGVKGWVGLILTNTLDMLAGSLPQDAKERAVSWWTPIFPAMVCGSWLLMSVLNAVLAQGLLTRLQQARRPRPPYGQLWLPDWLALGLAASALVGLLAGDDVGYLAANMAVVSGLPFAFLGLAFIHQRVRGRSQARLLLGLTYGMLILASGWAIALLAGVGLVRFWTMRFRRPTRGGGMEG